MPLPGSPAGGAGMMGAAPGGAAAPPTAGGGPAASPMTTPQPQEGLQKAARVEVQIAIKQLQKTLPAFPIESNENKAVMNALRALTNAFGKTESQDRELIPAEILQLLAAVNTATPGAGAMAGKPNPGAATPLPTGA